MMTAAREQLADDVRAVVAADVAVFSHMPDQLPIPAVLIWWADPAITPETWCAYVARFQIYVIGARIAPGPQLEAGEAVISDMLPGLQKRGYTLPDVGSPFPFTVAAVDYLAQIVTVEAEITS